MEPAAYRGIADQPGMRAYAESAMRDYVKSIDEVPDFYWVVERGEGRAGHLGSPG